MWQLSHHFERTLKSKDFSHPQLFRYPACQLERDLETDEEIAQMDFTEQSEDHQTRWKSRSLLAIYFFFYLYIFKQLLNNASFHLKS